MSDETTMADAGGGPRRGSGAAPGRVVAWVVVGGFGVYLIVSGVLGILAKS